MSEDSVFRYRLNPEPAGKTGVHRDRLTDLFTVILENLLDIIVPLRGHKDVKINGFRWLVDREECHPLFAEPARKNSDADAERGGNGAFQDAKNAAFYEPRIDCIRGLLESLLRLIELERGGQKVEVDGFRLRNLEDWLVNTPGDPAEIFEYAGNHCNCDCVFCYNKGTPSSLALASELNRTAEAEFQEMKTRAKYFSPAAGRGLFHSLGNIYEPMVHPYFMDILHLLREKTDRPFKIITNGKNLSTEAITELAELKPVYLYLSLHSSSPSRRQSLMRDFNPEIAIGALPLLREQSIPYSVVIVPWPVETIREMLDDLSSTVDYAAQHEVHLVQISLPGYSKYFPSAGLFDLDEVWQAIISRARELRQKYDCPIVTMPTMYEENIYQKQKNLPEIIGVVRNSPAYLAGLKKGDLIQQINGLSVRNRPQARDLLSTLQRSETGEARFQVRRESVTVEVNVDLTRYSYPYFKGIDNHLGIIFMGTGLRMSYIERLKEIIQSKKAKRVLFLSSALVKPTLEQSITESHLFGDGQVKIDIEIPENNFFGGNIFMGDLLVVQDFIDSIKKYIKISNGVEPDLVVIPSAPFNLSGWGRDLTGRVYLDIERETGVAVELLDCATIYD